MSNAFERLEPRFDQFQSSFWTEDHKSEIDCVLVLTSEDVQADSPYTLDDALTGWLLQVLPPAIYLVIHQDRIQLFLPTREYSQLSSRPRIPELTMTSCSEGDIHAIVLRELSTWHIATTSETAQNENLSELDLIEVDADIEAVLIPHDKSELMRARNAGKIADKFVQRVLVPQLESLINDREPMDCRSLAHRVAVSVNKPDVVKLEFQPPDVSTAFLPGISCGRRIDLSYPPVAVGRLTTDLIVATVGVRFKSYVAVLGRTYLINATPKRKATYKALARAHTRAIGAIKIGGPFSDVYDAYISELGVDLEGYASTVIGRFVGTQVGTTAIVVGKYSTGSFVAGSNLVVISNLKDVPDQDDPDLPISLQIIDTVQVGPDDVMAITKAAVKFKLVAYTISLDDEKELLAQVVNDPRTMAERTRRQQKGAQAAPEVDRRRERILNELRSTPYEKRAVAAGEATVSQAISYHNDAEVPLLRASNLIFVHTEAQTVFVPIYGVMVPFHIALIKGAIDERDGATGRSSSMKITFDVPKSDKADATHVYIRELTFSGHGSEKFKKVAKQIRDLRTQYMTDMKRKRDAKEVYVNEKLETIKEGQAPRLGGGKVQIRPTLSGKKNFGNLEAHVNGFRYRSATGEQLNVMYQNIRLAVMQLSVNELNTCIHFVLKRPVNIGNKPSPHVTFFKQVVESSMDVSVRASAMTDQAELAEEERERRFRKKVNHEFRDFQKAIAAQGLVNAPQFEKPTRELGFYGVPGRSRVLLMPTFSALISISDTPFVLMRDDIEIAVLERLAFSSSAFDLVFILNDWDVGDVQSKIVTITMIDINSKSKITEWLTAIEVRFYERRNTTEWKAALTAIRKDQGGREAFEATTGWDAVFADNEEESQESTDAFDPNEDSDAAEDDEDDEEFEAPDDEDEEAGSDDDDNDEGESWREMDERAAAADKRQERKWTEEQPKKKSGSSFSSSKKDGGHHHSDKKEKDGRHHHHHHHHKH
jgi:nucleosome binding factor SPN SPT16 subunit